MSLRLYELAGADPQRRFSPYVWRIRMALAHKELEVESVPWRFIEKQVIAATGQGAVPVLQHGQEMIHDSWTIACYLEEQFPDRPTLFGGDMGRGVTLLVQNWVNGQVFAALRPIIIMDVFAVLHAGDQRYFREAREKQLGMSLEDYANSSPEQIAAFRKSLASARRTLEAAQYLCGDGPGYADYILFGAFQWARCSCPVALLEKDDPLYDWRNRMLALFDGLGGNAVGYLV